MKKLFIFPNTILNILVEYKWYILGIFLTIFISSFLMVIEPFLLKKLVDNIVENKNTSVMFSNNMALLILFVIVSSGCNLIWRIINYLCLKTFPFIKSKIFFEAFNYLSWHDHKYFQENLSGDLANKVQDLGEAVESILESIFTLTSVIITIFITIIVAYTISVYFSLIITIWVTLFTYISIVLSKNIEVSSKEFAEAKSYLIGRNIDSLMNIFSIKLFSKERFETLYLKNISNNVAIKDVRLRLEMLKLWTIQGVLCFFILGIMAVILIFMKDKNLVSAGDFVFIISITTSIIQQIFGIAEFIANTVKQIGIFKQSFSHIYFPQVNTDKTNNSELKIKKAAIIFKNITFGYKDSNILFKKLNITIKPEEKVGLVGYSGSGKTSLINLLVRLYDVYEGEIIIDNQNVKDVALSSLRNNISFVPQNPILFNRSIIDNIRYGKLEATDADVINAAKRAHAHEFIINTYNGYESFLGEGGAKISGGERQRIALARALLKNAPILVLDEPTSGLDSLTESLIQENLKELTHGKTVITITHRLSTLINMDRIIVLDKGEIVENDTHNQLLKAKGLYYQLWNA
jgi:ATP-binding cassette subfamily B protein